MSKELKEERIELPRLSGLHDALALSRRVLYASIGLMVFSVALIVAMAFRMATPPKQVYVSCPEGSILAKAQPDQTFECEALAFGQHLSLLLFSPQFYSNYTARIKPWLDPSAIQELAKILESPVFQLLGNGALPDLSFGNHTWSNGEILLNLKLRLDADPVRKIKLVLSLRKTSRSTENPAGLMVAHILLEGHE